MIVLGFIADERKLQFLYERFLELQKSPEELLIEIEDALEAGVIAIEQLEELISNFK